MHRINLPWMLEVVSAVDALSTVAADTPLADHNWTLFNAKSQIEALFNQSIYSPFLRISREKAGTLHATIERVSGNAAEGAQVNQVDAWMIKNQRDQFATVFLSELSTLPSFLVGEKEGYDVSLLIEQGVRLFPASLPKKVPEAAPDSMEAGKALAFELATAAGFHIFRVVEAVIKRYWTELSKGAVHPKPQTIGTYASELENKKYGDPKVWKALKQMAKLHRNPLIHPEVILTVEEAIDTLGIARSVVGAMLRALPEVPPTTATASAVQS